jgi:NAD(P)H dehydrogenase (quinone)
MKTVLIVYASDHGGTEKMAAAVAEGVKSVADCRAIMKKAEETSAADLAECDALVVGSPVHMGSMDWRVKKFIDTVCSGAWMKNSMVGKIGAAFVCGSGYGGAGAGCELTFLAILNNIAELGLIIVPLPKNTPGYQEAGLQWGPYGRAHAEDLSPKGLSEAQLTSSFHHGVHIAKLARALDGASVFRTANAQV